MAMKRTVVEVFSIDSLLDGRIIRRFFQLCKSFFLGMIDRSLSTIKRLLRSKRPEGWKFSHRGHFSAAVHDNGPVLGIFFKDGLRFRADKEGCGECVTKYRLRTDDCHTLPFPGRISGVRVKNVAKTGAVSFEIPLIITRCGRPCIANGENPQVPFLPGMLDADPPVLA